MGSRLRQQSFAAANGLEPLRHQLDVADDRAIICNVGRSVAHTG